MYDPNLPIARPCAGCGSQFSSNLSASSGAGGAARHAGRQCVDAALAAAITLTVVEPNNNGLGSDALHTVDGAELVGLNAVAHPRVGQLSASAICKKCPSWDGTV